ncbi:hypothetical protein MRX96_010040 [Rhipicephalus microplus]
MKNRAPCLAGILHGHARHHCVCPAFEALGSAQRFTHAGGCSGTHDDAEAPVARVCVTARKRSSHVSTAVDNGSARRRRLKAPPTQHPILPLVPTLRCNIAAGRRALAQKTASLAARTQRGQKRVDDRACLRGVYWRDGATPPLDGGGKRCRSSCSVSLLRPLEARFAFAIRVRKV